MGNNNISFEDDCIRGSYAREIGNYFENNNLKNWHVSPSITKGEILIHPVGGLPENERSVSRISVQIRGGVISFGVSGYFPHQIDETKKILENKGYNYCNYRGFTEDGRPNGRWWLTKSLENLESVVEEFKSIEPVLLRNNSCKC